MFGYTLGFSWGYKKCVFDSFSTVGEMLLRSEFIRRTAALKKIIYGDVV